MISVETIFLGTFIIFGSDGIDSVSLKLLFSTKNLSYIKIRSVNIKISTVKQPLFTSDFYEFISE